MDKNETILPEPLAPGTSRPPVIPKEHSTSWRGIGVVLLCFVASFLGSWLFLATGLVKPDVTQTITQNQEKLVLAEGEIVSDVAQKVSPSVVSIVVESRQLSLFDTATTEAAGTGIIISKDGFILTNKHVIPANSSSVQVVLSNGRTFENVRVVGRDPLNDIAFLKLNDVGDLTPARLADSSDVRVGQQVVAIGNALGEFETTVTSGIVSGLSRDLVAGTGMDVERLEDLIQTDTAINPGNSGGPLVNLKGEVIGVNTAIADQAQGIGFAIPINATKGLIKSVNEKGRLARAYIGVRYVSLNADLAKEAGLSVQQGALIQGGGETPAIIANSPAAKAGLREGDVITKVDGADITRTNSLGLTLSQKVPGDTLTITYLRDGRTNTTKVTLEELR